MRNKDLNKDLKKVNKDSQISNEYITVCPDCGSTNTSFVGGGHILTNTICKDCGFISKNFPEIKKKDVNKRKINKLKKNISNSKINIREIKPPLKNFFIIYILLIIVTSILFSILENLIIPITLIILICLLGLIYGIYIFKRS